MGESKDRDSEHFISSPPLPPPPSTLARANFGGHKNREDSEEKTSQPSFANGINSESKYVWRQKAAAEPSPHPKV